MKPTVSVVTVARNEEKTIAHVVTKAITWLRRTTSAYEILVNDDASRDGTTRILDRLQKRNASVTVFHQKTPLGIARGMDFLYTKARYDYVFILPGDDQYRMEDLPAMLSRAESGCAVVVGRRKHKHYSLKRQIISWAFNRISWALFGVFPIDAGSTKVYRRSVLRSIPVVSLGVFNEAERIIRISKAGLPVCQADVVHLPRKGGESSGATINLIWEACRDMARVWYAFKKRGDGKDFFSNTREY